MDFKGQVERVRPSGMVIVVFIATQFACWGLWKIFDLYPFLKNKDIMDFLKILCITAPVFGAIWYLFKRLDRNFDRNLYASRAMILGDINIKIMTESIQASNEFKELLLFIYPDTLKNVYRTGLIINKQTEIYSIQDEKKFVEEGIRKYNPNISIKKLDEILAQAY